MISVALWHSSKAANSVCHDKILDIMVITQNAPEIYNKTAETNKKYGEGPSHGCVNKTSFQHHAVPNVAETKKANKHLCSLAIN